jgi:hypothetical protein
MVDLWSKCPIQKLWQIFKSVSSRPRRSPAGARVKLCSQGALARPCVSRGRVDSPLSSSPPRHRSMDKTPFSVASTPAMPLLPHCALRQTSACSLCRRTEPSPPSPFAQVRVASTRCTAIKGGHLCISSAPALCPPPVSHCCHFRPCFRDRLTIARPNQPPPFFLGRSRSTHPLRRSSPRHGWLPRPQEPPGTAAAHR